MVILNTNKCYDGSRKITNICFKIMLVPMNVVSAYSAKSPGCSEFDLLSLSNVQLHGSQPRFFHEQMSKPGIARGNHHQGNHVMNLSLL